MNIEEVDKVLRQYFEWMLTQPGIGADVHKYLTHVVYGTLEPDSDSRLERLALAEIVASLEKAGITGLHLNYKGRMIVNYGTVTLLLEMSFIVTDERVTSLIFSLWRYNKEKLKYEDLVGQWRYTVQLTPDDRVEPGNGYVWTKSNVVPLNMLAIIWGPKGVK